MLTPLTNLYETTVSTVYAKVESLLDSVHLDRVRKWFQTPSVVEGATAGEVAAVPPPAAESGSISSAISTVFLVLRIFLYIFPLLFAVLVANHLIFMPWQVRLFAFIFVYIYMGIYPVFTIGIPAYYILNALFSAYHNFNLPSTLTPAEKLARQKQYYPVLRGFLPISTWKTDSLWTFETLLFLFKYKPVRMSNNYKAETPPLTAAEITYNNSRLEYEQYCAQLIPGYDTLIKTGFGEALKQAYDMHMKDLNYSPVTITPKPDPKKPTIPLISSKPSTVLTPPEGPDTVVPTTVNPIRKGNPSLPEGPPAPQTPAGSSTKPKGNSMNPTKPLEQPK